VIPLPVGRNRPLAPLRTAVNRRPGQPRINYWYDGRPSPGHHPTRRHVGVILDDRIVRGHDDCDAFFSNDVPEKGHNLLPGLAVQLTSRLVRQDQVRVGGKRPGNCYRCC